MARHEFSRQTKRAALLRSGQRCEAVGEVYGLQPGQRCNGHLSAGVEFDHWPIPATDRDSDGIDNCVACCKVCHAFKTAHYDIPMQAKGKRISDKHRGIRQRGQGFRKAEPQRTATRPIEKWSLLK